ncbi:putative nuclease HARBI1 [Megalops cyprinoides]|uniref:putative nuclease HARBI1 n=1 Tax=Megalops cyprinoides TaxID=118141 RepID=UPI001865435E|nr:putative nuclease HARBI1 [Megalops cyprinoides]
MADIDAVLFMVARRNIRRKAVRSQTKKRFRLHQNVQQLPDELLIQRCRFDRETIKYLCGVLNDKLVNPYAHNHPLSLEAKICAALAYYTSNSFQTAVGNFVGVSQSTISHAVTHVTDALVELGEQFIQFPPPESHQREKQQFCNIAGFPDVLGVVGCMHIAIRAPPGDPHTFLNHKSFHSLKVQITADVNSTITSVVARFPGSSKDSFIWSKSPMAARCAAGCLGTGHLLGGSGYPLRPWLLTPVRHPSCRAEELYNEALKKTHSTVMRTCQLLKKRFRCLEGTRVLNCFPEKCGRIIIACCVLHNIAVSRGVELPPNEGAAPGQRDRRDSREEEEEDKEDEGDEEEDTHYHLGKQKREAIIQQHFEKL